jgi:tRNA nucleotidyltransferase (CCA-adding enzyme)
MQNISPQAIKALNILNNNGCEAYLVGGCVRDILLGADPKDWDITTNALPQETEKAFADCKIIKTGLRHGTLTVLIDGLPLEITTYRVDGRYRDNRRPDEVRFVELLREDLARRDFTVNSLAMDKTGKIKDYFGGADDIKNKIIKCVGDPDKRFREDGLRILRALRFASVIDFSVEARTSDALFADKELLRNISAERINAELTKLLCGINAKAVLKEYAEIIGIVIPEILPCIGFDQHNPYHIHDVWGHTLEVVANAEATPVMRWTALLHDIGKPRCFALDENGVGHSYKHETASGEIAEEIMRRLKFDNAGRKTIKTLICAHMDAFRPTKKAVKRLMNKYGEDMLRALLGFKRADILGHSEEYRRRQNEISECERLIDETIAENECFSLRDLAVNGNDMMALGLKKTEISKALNLLLANVIDGNVENEKDALTEYCKTEIRFNQSLPE